MGVSIEEEVKALKGKLKATFSLSLMDEADINVKYNVLTGEWSLNENAPDQNKALHVVKKNKTASQKVKELFGSPPPKEVKNGEAFIEGDIIRTDFKVEGKAEIIGELKQKYYLINSEASLKLTGEMKSFVGVERIIGFDNQRGPFTQDRVFFSGLQYEIKAEYKVCLGGWCPDVLNNTLDDKGNFIEPFDFKTSRSHIMEIFK